MTICQLYLVRVSVCISHESVSAFEFVKIHFSPKEDNLSNLKRKILKCWVILVISIQQPEFTCNCLVRFKDLPSKTLKQLWPKHINKHSLNYLQRLLNVHSWRPEEKEPLSFLVSPCHHPTFSSNLYNMVLIAFSVPVFLHCAMHLEHTAENRDRLLISSSTNYVSVSTFHLGENYWPYIDAELL